MGIRVHKAIGYGIRNLRLDGTTPKDVRWDYEGFMKVWQEREDDLAGYLKWCEDHKDLLVQRAMHEETCDRRTAETEHFLMCASLKDAIERGKYWAAPYSALLWGYEGMLPEVLLLIPPEHHATWFRFDDIIDYCEEQSPFYEPKSRATPLTGSTGIYPYNGVMRRIRPPVSSQDVCDEVLKAAKVFAKHEPVSDTILPGGVYNRIVGRWAPGQPPIVTDPGALQHFRRDWRPVLPMGILALIEYLGCFPDPYGTEGITAHLRPMLYVFWR